MESSKNKLSIVTLINPMDCPEDGVKKLKKISYNTYLGILLIINSYNNVSEVVESHLQIKCNLFDDNFLNYKSIYLEYNEDEYYKDTLSSWKNEYKNELKFNMEGIGYTYVFYNLDEDINKDQFNDGIKLAVGFIGTKLE